MQLLQDRVSSGAGGTYCPKYMWWRGDVGLHLLMAVMFNSCPSISEGTGIIVPGLLWAHW